MTNDLLAAVRDLPKVSKYLHVPVQSGSNAVLQRMKRGYTVEEYREMLARTREWIPGVAVTSDFIVGFCGETDDDFQLTMDLVRESRFKNSFIFKYSERPGTKGAELYADDVPDDVKRRRNNELLALQNEISEADNQAFLGQQVTVLVEGPSKAAERHAHTLTTTADSRQPTARSAPAHRPHPLRPDRRLRRQPPPDRPLPADRHLRRQRPHAVRRSGHAARRAGAITRLSATGRDT